MNTIKGFALNRNFVNNAPGVVADIGELSQLGYTFAKEPRVYSSQTYPTLSLVHMPTKGSGVGFSAAIPDDQVAHILNVINNIYTKSLSNTNPIAPGEFVTYLQNQMGAAVANITVGGQVISGNRSIVEWIQWNNPAVDNTNINKVWFVNSSFEGQFDEYDFTVIPPFTPVSQFFGQPADVKALLASRNYNQQTQAIEDARGGTNESFVWGNEYNYVNPVNANDKTPAKFAVLGYGEAANNIDLIKQAIVDYLLTNSTQTRDQWKAILPDLFLRTEVMLFPQWGSFAIENVVGGNNGIYSPIQLLSSILTQITNDATGYDPTFVQNNAQIFTFPYMSIAIGSCGNAENRDGKTKLSDWFPDYFFTPNTSADFNRMSLDTQGWFQMMMAMLPIARDMTSGSTVPNGYTRVIRGTKMYLAKSYDDVQFLVQAQATP
ncbi:putative virion stractural protein [Burkholderia phage FLC6]|nr:putative virion stractural protein [Burkholderia phage FLC6]